MAAATISVPVSAPKAVNPWLLATTVPLAAFMELLDTTIVNVAVEHIGGGLSSSTDEATYVLTSYLVANVIVLPLSGYLTGLLGRKNYYLWSVAIFTIASALCGFAPSLGVLVLFRILQGLGGGGLQPLSQAILMDAFPPERRSTAQAVFSVTAVIAPALGPTVGGFLTDNYSWRWIFLVNIPIGILAFVLNSRLIQDPPHIARFTLGEKKFDYQGLSLLAICLGSMQVVLDRGQIDDWFGSNFITTFTVFAVVALIAFIWCELKHEHPVVDLRLLKNTNFTLSVTAMFIMGFVFYAANYMQPLFCQQMLGWTATWAGLALSPGAIVFIAMMPVMPKLIRSITPRYMVLIGFIVHGLACLVMAGWYLQYPFYRVLGTRIFEIVGLAWLMVPINVMAFGFLSKEKITSGSGLLSLARNFGASCGVSLAATVLARRSQVHQNMLVSHLTPGDESYRIALSQGAQALFHHGMSFADAAKAAVALVGKELERQATMLSYMDAFWLLAIGSFLAAPLPLLIRKPKAAPSAAEIKKAADAE
jgi:MFS transporter, DHA2 family, multidrug resistance protein